MTGYIRFPVAAGVLTPNVEHDKRMWFGRDHLVMAQALGWEEVAPFYIDLETPVPANGIPNPVRSTCIGPTITCDMRSRGFRWQACF